jgi:uncharacterized protein
MLVLGMHPQDDIEAAVGRAYNRWLIERILPDDERIKGGFAWDSDSFANNRSR